MYLYKKRPKNGGEFTFIWIAVDRGTNQVIDFEGKKHTTEYSYFLAVATDPKVKDLIDYDSKLGKEIQQTAEWQLNEDKGLSR